MKKTILFIPGIIILSLFIGCKKQDSPAPQQAVVNPEKNEQIPAEAKQTIEAIQKFRATVKEYHASKNYSRPTASGNMLPDSAAWLLEATLNFDFDRERPEDKNPNTRMDSLIVPDIISLDSAGNINTSDLINVYDQIAVFCANIYKYSDKIKIVDVVTIDDPMGIRFKAYAVVIISAKPAYPFKPDCKPFTTETAMWSYLYSQLCYSTINDAPTLCQTRLNCQNINGHGCFGGFIWYSNVNNVLRSNVNNTYPAALYYLNNAPMCNSTVLNATAMNNYVNGCTNLAVAGIPVWGGPPPYFTVANYDLKAATIGLPIIKDWWFLTVTYGRPFCNLQYYPPYIP